VNAIAGAISATLTRFVRGFSGPGERRRSLDVDHLLQLRFQIRGHLAAGLSSGFRPWPSSADHQVTNSLGRRELVAFQRGGQKTGFPAVVDRVCRGVSASTGRFLPLLCKHANRPGVEYYSTVIPKIMTALTSAIPPEDRAASLSAVAPRIPSKLLFRAASGALAHGGFPRDRRMESAISTRPRPSQRCRNLRPAFIPSRSILALTWIDSERALPDGESLGNRFPRDLPKRYGGPVGRPYSPGAADRIVRPRNVLGCDR